MVRKLDPLLTNIKIVLTDVDGVLTDGGMYYTNKGDIMKKFHARDGMGITILRENNIPVIIVTKEKTIIVKKWAKKMKVLKIFEGVKQKETMIKKIKQEFGINASEIAFIGDDINDIELIKKVGFSAVPKDANSVVKKYSKYVCETKGGDGVLREITDLIIATKPNSKLLYYYEKR